MDFIFVSDLIDCSMLAIDGIGRRGAYHISSGSDFSIAELYDEAVKALALDPRPEPERRPRNPDDAPTILLDPSRTKVDFNWTVSVKLAQGVVRTIEYYREFGVSETFTHLKHEEESGSLR